MAVSAEPVLQRVLQARGINKYFGLVQALKDVDLSVYPGEVVALIGDNGAGKSTLIKVLTGVLPLEAGEIVFGGEPVRFSSLHEARAHGIETVYQDPEVARFLYVADCANNTPANAVPMPAADSIGPRVTAHPTSSADSNLRAAVT